MIWNKMICTGCNAVIIMDGKTITYIHFDCPERVRLEENNEDINITHIDSVADGGTG